MEVASGAGVVRAEAPEVALRVPGDEVPRAEILMPPTDQDYGSRDFVARDPEGNLWCFGTYSPGA